MAEIMELVKAMRRVAINFQNAIVFCKFATLKKTFKQNVYRVVINLKRIYFNLIQLLKYWFCLQIDTKLL